MNFNERINELNKKIAKAEKIVFFTGAGISTESGIKDFRSADGLWTETPESMCHVTTMLRRPHVFFPFYKQSFDCRAYKPNIAHIKIAELEKMGKKVTVVTQNVDSLHQKAGSTAVHELHGTIAHNHCVECFEVYDEDFIFDFDKKYPDAKIPVCPKCGGMVRPNIVCFGEPLPFDAFANSIKAIREADLVIVCGTSLVVQPAVGMINWVPYDNLVIINRDETPYDCRAELVFHQGLGEVFAEVKTNE